MHFSSHLAKSVFFISYWQGNRNKTEYSAPLTVYKKPGYWSFKLLGCVIDKNCLFWSEAHDVFDSQRYHLSIVINQGKGTDSE